MEEVTSHVEGFIPEKREVNAKTGNHEKDDDGGSSEDDTLPSVSDEPSERGGGIYPRKDRQYLIMANSYPKGQHKAQSVQDRIVSILP